MNDRAVTLAGALLGALLLIALVYTPPGPTAVSRPTTAETGANGYRGLVSWLELEGVPAVSLRRRFDADALFADRPRAGSVLITTLPYRRALRDSERLALTAWVDAGNTLLVLAALNETPDWLAGLDTVELFEELTALSGLDFVDVSDAEGELISIGETFELTALSYLPFAAHPLMAGVTQLSGHSDLPTTLWRPELSGGEAFVARLAHDSEHGADMLWQIPRGRGQVILSASGSLLSNAELGRADNAVFVANLLAWHLAPGGAVLFDDMHQGLSDLYDPDAFFGDRRLHNSLWLLLGFWLLYLLGGSTRFGTASTVAAAPAQGELVAAAGRFMGRKLDRAAAGRAMIDSWLHELRGSKPLVAARGSEFPAAELARLPTIDQQALHRLHEAYSRLGRGEKVDLTALHNTIQALRRTIR